nr:MAG TPA: hypothetical protein [Microviridae sp.]
MPNDKAVKIGYYHFKLLSCLYIAKRHSKALSVFTLHNENNTNLT